MERKPEITSSAPLGNAFKVLVIGRLDPIKRFDWLIDEVSRLPEHVSLDNVGDGAARGELAQQIIALGVGDRGYWVTKTLSAFLIA